MKLFIIIKEYIHSRPKIKKVIGGILILVGLVALFTPFTPGSWLVFIGLELFGLRILLSDKSSVFLRSIKNVLNKLKFCPSKKTDSLQTEKEKKHKPH